MNFVKPCIDAMKCRAQTYILLLNVNKKYIYVNLVLGGVNDVLLLREKWDLKDFLIKKYLIKLW